ncbi:MAG: hypothetical protein RLZZ628_409, partial [Bacteroidota bacterium]
MDAFCLYICFFNPKKKQKMKYPGDFSSWTTQLVHDAFGFQDAETLPSLTEWMDMPIELNRHDTERIEEIIAYSKRRVAFWSEGDIKLKLLGPMLLVANVDNPTFSTFSEMTVKCQVKTIQNKLINVLGRPDLIVAKGEFEPTLPYFCMQEYKPKQKTNDPRGQTLIALVAAHQLNLEAGYRFPVLYGAFNIGRDWTFLTLEGNRYALSRGYFLDNQTDFEHIVRRFRALKAIIYKLLDNFPP